MKIYSLLVIFALMFSLSGCSEPNESERIENVVSPDEIESMMDDPEFLSDYMNEIADAIEEEKMDKDMALVDELISLEDDKKVGKGLKGSCNAIAEGSTCIEYYGSFWNKSVIKMGCEEGTGKFSSDACPRDAAGGCNTGNGTVADMVAWMYLRGGGEMTSESIKYAKMACDATPASLWIPMN